MSAGASSTGELGDADRNRSGSVSFPTLIMEVQEEPYWVVHRRNLDPRAYPPFMRDDDAMFVTREGDIILECFLAESFANAIRTSGEVSPDLWRGYVPLKPRTSNSMTAMRHFQRAQQNAEWRRTESVAATESVDMEDSGGDNDVRLGGAVQLLCVTITPGCMCKALFTGKAHLAPWFDGVNVVLPLTRENYGDGLEVHLHDVNIPSTAETVIACVPYVGEFALGR
jgi:hypothetical protein